MVLVADSRFQLRIAGYGLALGVTGVAAFLGTVAAPVCARRWQPLSMLAVAFVPPGVAAYVGGVSPGLAVLVTGLAVTAFSFQLLKVLVDALVGRQRETGAPAVMSSRGGRRSPPVLLHRVLWPEIEGLTGDVGARGMLAGRADVVELDVTSDLGSLDDVDSPEDLA